MKKDSNELIIDMDELAVAILARWGEERGPPPVRIAEILTGLAYSAAQAVMHVLEGAAKEQGIPAIGMTRMMNQFWDIVIRGRS